jgi:hypothetical protein
MSFKFVQNLIFFLAKMVKDHGLKVYIGHDGIGLLFYWGATSRHIRILPLWKILLSPSENGIIIIMLINLLTLAVWKFLFSSLKKYFMKVEW